MVQFIMLLDTLHNLVDDAKQPTKELTFCFLHSCTLLSPQSPVMILGSHQLKGKVETLKEPFCILEKEYIDEILHYKVVGVVTEKLLFNQYPKIIMR
jgi:hypothetical protein